MADSAWHFRDNNSYSAFVSNWLVTAMTPRWRAVLDNQVDGRVSSVRCPGAQFAGSFEDGRRETVGENR